MMKSLYDELKASKADKSFKANHVLISKQPKDQGHGADTHSKVMAGIHKRTHIAKKSSKPNSTYLA